MRYFLTIAVFLLSGLFAIGQNNVVIKDTRLVAGGRLNDTAFAIQSTVLDLELTSFTGDVVVTFNTDNAKDLTNNAKRYVAKRSMNYRFRGNFKGLEERLKRNNTPEQVFFGEWEIMVGDVSMPGQAVEVKLSRLKGTTGKTQLVTFKGEFNPADFELDTDRFKWTDVIQYSIILTVITYD